MQIRPYIQIHIFIEIKRYMQGGAYKCPYRGLAPWEAGFLNTSGTFRGDVLCFGSCMYPCVIYITDILMLVPIPVLLP